MEKVIYYKELQMTLNTMFPDKGIFYVHHAVTKKVSFIENISLI